MAHAGQVQAPQARYVDEALDATEPFVALAAVLSLDARAPWMPRTLLAELTGTLADALPDGDARVVARWLNAGALAGSDPERARMRLAEIGFVERWSILGPFPNEGMAGMRRAFPPETDGFVPDVPVEGRVLPVVWQAIDQTGERGYVDLAARIRPADAAVVYAATDLHVVRPIRATLHLSVDGAYRLWVNGDPVAARDDALGGALLRDRVDVTLHGGRNRILLKVGSDTGPFGFHFRVTDTREQSIPMLRVAPPAPHGESVVQTESWPVPRDLAARIEEALAEPDAGAAEEGADVVPHAGTRPSGHLLAAAAYVLRVLQPRDPAEPWERWRARAAQADDLGPWDMSRLSRTFTEQWHRVHWLERAAASGDPWLKIRAAEAVASQMGATRQARARDMVNEVLQEVPGMVEARTLLAELLWEAGLHYRALAMLAGVVADAPDVAAAEDILADWAVRARDDAHLPVLLERAFHRTPWDLIAAAHLVELHLAAGAGERAHGVIDVLGSWREGDPEVLLLRARAARALGEHADALEALARAADMRPGDAGIPELRGRLMVELGDSAAAAAAFEEALARAPQAATVRGWRDRLSPGGEGFHLPWRITAEELRERAASVDTREGDLTWLVDQKKVQVYRNGLATTWVQRAALVHSRVGTDLVRWMSLYYTPDAEVLDIMDVRILKPDGRVIEAHEVRDTAISTGPSAIYYDVRTRSLAFPDLDVGDILIVEYQVADIAYRNLFDDYFGDVFFVEGHAARLHVRYGLIGPPDRPFHFNEQELQRGTLTRTSRGNDQFIVYEARDLPRQPREGSAPGPSDLFEMVSVSTFGDWNTLADWYWNLIREQLVVSSTMEELVGDLVDGLDRLEDRVAAIHNFVVRNIRYVALPFGIHGYKPYRTSDCLGRRFGDCKDTAALMKVMMGIAGIDAYIVLIRTRDLGRVSGDPPSLSVFNHAILWVPELDLYLDGTAAHWGAFETPALDQAASALIVLDGHGGRFLQTPLLPADSSQSETRLELDLRAALDGHGPATGSGEVILRGEFAAPFRRHWESADQRRERYQAQLGRSIPGISVTEASFGPLDDIEAPASVAWTFSAGEWFRRSADEIVLRPFGPSEATWTQRFAGAAERRLPLQLDHTMLLTEVRTIHVGPDVKIAAGLGAHRAESAFGRVARDATLGDDGVLRVSLHLQFDRIDIPVADYPAFRAFLLEVDRIVDLPLRWTHPTGER